jgi:NADH:ubiquinone oxidoreductase subunit 5 (subunit L)/multisubunit Na+/H+ antiporter MnhA subunit
MLSGIPPFSTFPAEVIMFAGIFERGDVAGIVIGVIGLLAVMLTIAYVFHFARKVFFGPLPTRLASDGAIKDPPWLMLVPLLALVVLSAVLGLYPALVMDLLAPVVSAQLGA